MGDLSEHFSRREFACHCGCGADGIEQGVIGLLERIRGLVGKPITVNCGVRCAAHNKACGGVKRSQHLLGKAADISVDGIPPKTLAKLVEDNFSVGGLGIYQTFIHIDIRSGKARWGEK